MEGRKGEREERRKEIASFPFLLSSLSPFLL